MLNEIFYQDLTKTVEEIDQIIIKKHRETLIKLEKHNFSQTVKCIKQNNNNNEKMKECVQSYYQFSKPVLQAISHTKSQFNECLMKKHSEENLNKCLKELKVKLVQEVDLHIHKSLKLIK